MTNDTTLEGFATAHAAQTETHEVGAPWTESLWLLDPFNRRRVVLAEMAPPGRYIEFEGDEAAWLLPLEREVTRIGRGLAVHVHLDDQHVSRRHAIIAVDGSSVRILDDRSSNGTFVNGRRVAESELLDGDVVVAGSAVLRYREV